MSVAHTCAAGAAKRNFSQRWHRLQFESECDNLVVFFSIITLIAKLGTFTLRLPSKWLSLAEGPNLEDMLGSLKEKAGLS